MLSSFAATPFFSACVHEFPITEAARQRLIAEVSKVVSDSFVVHDLFSTRDLLMITNLEDILTRITMTQESYQGVMVAVICLGVVSAICITDNAFADANSDWLARSTAPGVVMATRFDTQAEVDDYVLQDNQADRVSWQQSGQASGNGSLRFEILNTDNPRCSVFCRTISHN